MTGLPEQKEERLLVGFQSSDDAAVYQMNEEQALIQTIDFFPPPVDDPYLFGQIAAANALSDVYAMGGKPVLALNLLSFPSCLDPECIREILRGGYEKVAEAGAVVAGGHTIEDTEPKYGLSVSGIVHPDHIWKNDSAKEGDVLILTKPIGTGIYALASRGGLLSDEEEKEMLKWMTMLNRRASEIMKDFTVHACTDITGFGLLGHLYEMAQGSSLSAKIRADQVPFLPRTKELAEMGILPSGMYQNKGYLEKHVRFEPDVKEWIRDTLMDPQTSGGLLAAIPAEEKERCLQAMEEQHCFAKVIGTITASDEAAVQVLQSQYEVTAY